MCLYHTSTYIYIFYFPYNIQYLPLKPQLPNQTTLNSMEMRFLAGRAEEI